MWRESTRVREYCSSPSVQLSSSTGRLTRTTPTSTNLHFYEHHTSTCTMMIARRLLVLPALVALAARNADAFTPANFGSRTTANTAVRFSMVASETDVSIEYDAAARLAYKDWCAKFGKDASESKFETFKANYETVTVANVSAAKKARDSGTDRPKDLELNEFGDMSEEEYLQMQAGASAPAPAPEKGAMQSVMEASMAQSDASNALAEAADALAEEEEELAKALGLNSVEELEEAIDAVQGFDTDGGPLDTSDVREVRVRSAYMEWCKEYGKQPDESRFPTFSSNFLAMEEYANENGREMVLNKYADCTEEEYRKLTNTAAPAPELVVEKPVEKAVAAPKKEEPKKEEPKKEEPKEEAPKVEAKEEKPKPAPKAPPKQEPAKQLSLEEEAIMLAKAAAEAEAAQVAKRRALDEQAAEIERQKAAEALKKQQKTVVPTPPKSQPKEEGNIFSSLFQSAPKKAEAPAVKKEVVKEETTDAQARLKAAGAVVAQQRKDERDAIKKAKLPQKPVQPTKEEGAGFLSSIFGMTTEKAPAKPAAPAKPVAPVKPMPPAPVKAATEAEKKVEVSLPFSFFKPAEDKPEPKATPDPPKPSSPKKSVGDIDVAPNAMTEALNSFFGAGNKAPAPVAPPKPEPAPVSQVSKPKPQPFNLFGGVPAAPKKVEVKPAAPKPAPVRKPSPTLSLFGGSAPKTAAPPAPQAPVSAPAPKGSGTFSLFSSPLAAKVEPAPAPKPVAAKPAPVFGGLFGGSPAPKPAPKASPQPPKPVEKAPVKGSGTFTLFGGGASTPSKPVAQKPPVQQKAPVKKSTPNGVAGIGGFTSFGAPKKAAKPPARASGTISVTKQARGPGTISLSSPKKTPPPAPVTAPKTPAKGSGTFSIFGGLSTPSPSKPTPVAEPVKQKTVSKPSGGFSLFGGAGAKQTTSPKVVADDIPVVSKFTQNADGSITGIVRNSKISAMEQKLQLLRLGVVPKLVMS
ncbi:hypothetical protein HJC23_005635 [Cyclotella cryptica]|uniref:Cathepsin propeptide inhibitor domain-containing protein n=1 Tax=Cyclotella cryptica TaxID=29204 RepID=A0ABD3PY83_9STRA|eukprot:CCRYP_010503-RB/>CCRYP_010503-RB protein AED:0.05 eAED:0.05 QI:767/1/1/1/1/1/6/315/970